MGKYFTLLLFAGLTAAPVRAAPPPSGLWFMGATGSESSNTYVGLVHALPGGRLGRGWAVRGSLGAGTYTYEAAESTKAKYTSASAGLIYQSSGGWGWSNVSVGPRLTRTKLSRNDPGNKERGSRWDLMMQSDGGLQGSEWDARWIGSYGLRDRGYLARLQLGLKFNEKVSIGPEFGLQGGRSYRQRSAGAVVRTRPFKDLQLQASAGILRQRDRGSRGYVGLALSRPF